MHSKMGVYYSSFSKIMARAVLCMICMAARRVGSVHGMDIYLRHYSGWVGFLLMSFVWSAICKTDLRGLSDMLTVPACGGVEWSWPGLYIYLSISRGTNVCLVYSVYH